MANKIDVYNLAKYGLNLAERSNSNLSCAEIFFGKNNYINRQFKILVKFM